MKRVLIILLVVAGGIGTLLCGGLVYVASEGPDTFVVPGSQMDRSHARTVRDLGLIEDDEEIRYFYSDALLDIREGMYFITDEKLVLYCDSWEEPAAVAPYNSIVNLDAVWNDSFFVDSTFQITLDDGEVWTFPVSSERGLDRVFYEYIEERIQEPAPRRRRRGGAAQGR